VPVEVGEQRVDAFNKPHGVVCPLAVWAVGARVQRGVAPASSRSPRTRRSRSSVRPARSAMVLLVFVGAPSAGLSDCRIVGGGGSSARSSPSLSSSLLDCRCRCHDVVTTDPQRRRTSANGGERDQAGKRRNTYVRGDTRTVLVGLKIRPVSVRIRLGARPRKPESPTQASRLMRAGRKHRCRRCAPRVGFAADDGRRKVSGAGDGRTGEIITGATTPRLGFGSRCAVMAWQ